MTMPETDMPEESQESLLDLDSFMTMDNVDPVWIHGLMVYLGSQGGIYARSLEAWREVLVTYQALR